MARFLMSPGVMTRETDASQYTVTTATGGNSVALVGYAEKGPFDPVLVANRQDFEKTFGKTLPESPYLAMTAYKLFEEGQQLLIVRAGDDRSPDVVPTAAKYASKEIRILGESGGRPATAGFQEFLKTTNLDFGTYTVGTQYAFDVLADHRAFKSAKTVEKWNVFAYETVNGFAGQQGLPANLKTEIQNAVAKIAYDAESPNNFIVNYKAYNSNSQALSTGEYTGIGSRNGTTAGSSLTASITRYRTNNTYTTVADDTITMNLKYGSAALGGTNLREGYDFSGAAKSFSITIGTSSDEFILDANYADVDELVNALNSQRNTLASKVEFSKFSASGFSTDSCPYSLLISKIDNSNSGMTLIAGSQDALTILGIIPKTYEDKECLLGTYTATTPLAGVVYQFEGIIFLSHVSTSTGVKSFEDKATIKIQSPISGSWTLTSIKDAINTALADAYPLYTNGTAARATASIVNGKIRLQAIGPNTETTKSIVEISAPSSGDPSLIQILNGTAPYVEGLDAADSIGESRINLVAKERGSYGNKLALKVESGTRKIDMTTSIPVNNVYVYYDGKEVSSYIGIYWGDGTAKDSKGVVLGVEAEKASPNYILNKMASDPWISIEAEDEDGNSTMGRLPAGMWTLGDDKLPQNVTAEQAEIVSFVKGTNGWIEGEGGTITSFSSDLVAALQKIQNPEVYDYNIVAAPGAADTVVQNAIQDLCESRRDCFGVINAAPFGRGLGIRNNTTHISQVNVDCENLTSSYVAAYWPWLQDYDSDNKRYVWLSPDTYALKTMIYTDNVSDPWFAPAGNRRGKVTAIDVEYSPTVADRDILYGDTNIVNPIVKFVNEGITIWGQKTAQRTKSATDRINVRRLMIYAERLIARMARTFLFEPNDQANWASFARQANAILEPIRQRRGVYQYQVICDATTNTPDLINQNIMSGKIFLQPTKTIEFLEVSFTINAATGETTIQE